MYVPIYVVEDLSGIFSTIVYRHLFHLEKPAQYSLYRSLLTWLLDYEKTAVMIVC